MTYDHAVTNQISSWIRNFTCSSAISQALIMYVALGFKIMTLTSIQHTGTLIFFPQRQMVGCFQAFDSIFPLGRRPPTPQPPNNTPRNSCLPPSSGQPPFYKPHTMIYSCQKWMLTLMNLRFMLEQICCFRHETLLVKVS